MNFYAFMSIRVALTTLNHYGAHLSIVRERLKLHGTRQDQRKPIKIIFLLDSSQLLILINWLLLGHVKQCFVIVQPQVVIWDGHFVKRDGLGVLEEAIWSPYILKQYEWKCLPN